MIKSIFALRIQSSEGPGAGSYLITLAIVESSILCAYVLFQARSNLSRLIFIFTTKFDACCFKLSSKLLKIFIFILAPQILVSDKSGEDS